MLTANIVNLFDETIFFGRLSVENGRIAKIERIGPEHPDEVYVLPGFVDAHVHIESSLLTPPQFARLAVVHGTVATVSDPHEIGNVLGIGGVMYMLAEARRTPFKFRFGAPSCVPATPFETSGAELTAKEVRYLLEQKDIGYLSEVMNVPGVLHQDPDLMAKLTLAKAFNKPIDGHAPALRGDALQQYIDEGIRTDHESFTYEEGREKAIRGMHILIREGSAARNFDALLPLLAEFPKQIMFCSDDKHPDQLVEGHIDQLVRRALEAGHSVWNALRAACLNPVLHYRLPVGLLREGDPADYIIVDNLLNFTIRETVIAGETVAADGVSHLPDVRSEHENHFNASPITPAQLAVKANPNVQHIRVIEALDGQLITNELQLTPTIENGLIVPNVQDDVLKIVVVNRYRDASPSVGFVRNFGLQHGAIASSVGHDSHNITAVGCDDESLARAINLVIEAKGGLVATVGHQPHRDDDEAISRRDFLHLVTTPTDYRLRLPVAGLMSDEDGYDIADQYRELDAFVRNDLKSNLAAPFMTLSFMSLLVIPSLKLSDQALFDTNRFCFTELQKID